jgi:radical SAM superfamily enzyme YgiQ (UPF0313 family)
MIYKKGPLYRARSFEEISEDIEEASRTFGAHVKTLFFPAGNTIAMPTTTLASICRFAREKFPQLERITVYGSSQYIAEKGLEELITLREAGLTRIHVGLESGDDEILKRVKKGTTSSEQIRAGRWVKEAGIELSEYVILGLGGVERSEQHASATAETINAIGPDFVRLRTLIPKVNTLLLHQIRKGQFQPLGPHQVLRETKQLVEHLTCPTKLRSDHYSNYINLEGRVPEDKERLIKEIDHALQRSESEFRSFFVGTQ